MAKRQSENRNQVESSQVCIGIDVGYGITKAVTDSSSIAFPSVAGYGREIKFREEELANRYPNDQVWDDDGHWFLGNLALSQLRPGEQLRLRGRTANEAELGNVFRTRLAKAALAKALGDKATDVIHVRIATGLPVDHMRDSGQVKAALVGQHLIKTDHVRFIANVTDVMVMPQPYGSLYANMLMPNGELNDHYAYRRTGIVDVGTYTVDVTLDDNGEYIESESGSAESGVYTAQERISAAIEREYREKPGQRQIEMVLRSGYLIARGEHIDFRTEVKEALGPLRSATMSLLSEKWRGGLNVDAIFITGGGAELVKDDVIRAYPQAQVLSEPQFANARGYLYYANFSRQQPEG